MSKALMILLGCVTVFVAGAATVTTWPEVTGWMGCSSQSSCSSRSRCCAIVPEATESEESKSSGCTAKCETGPSCCTDEVLTAAQAPSTTKVSAVKTVIDVEDMDCPSCAKKIVAKVKDVTGVAKAEPDTGKQKLTVFHAENSKVSPRAVWEAVEKAGFKPVRLEGPTGNFTAKPKD